MKAIFTKYHGPTTNRGSRVSASDSDGNRVTVSYRDENSFRYAAKSLCEKMKWDGELIEGGTKTGPVFVFAPTPCLQVSRAVLVYQAGIANVFAVDSFNMSDYGRSARRLFQGTFRAAEALAAGLALAGTKVTSVQCNKAGDIAKEQWSEDLHSAPFSDQFRPVFSGVKQ